jgi:hypothetical protein
MARNDAAGWHNDWEPREVEAGVEYLKDGGAAWHINQVITAEFVGERDPILGMSAKVMLGAPIKAGTGFSEILFDERTAIQFAESTPEQRVTNNVQRFNDTIIEEDMYNDTTGECSSANIRLNVAIPEASYDMDGLEEEEDINIVTLD